MLVLSCEELDGGSLILNICINISLQMWVQLCSETKFITVETYACEINNTRVKSWDKVVSVGERVS